ncbi:MAG: hypothetical protein CMD46_04475 [Gammaproteobacteria bacterium]|nr:hypothetical protein [Gammaproteobacteria bacterium]
MEYLVFCTAILLLIGSISMAIPSKSSRELAKVRMESKLLGCKITSILNIKSKFKNKESLDVSYQIKNKTNLKEGHFIRDKDKLILYSPVKLKYSDKFNYINSVLQGMSVNLVEVIFNNVSVSFLWKENTGIDELKKILIDIDKLNNF